MRLSESGAGKIPDYDHPSISQGTIFGKAVLRSTYHLGRRKVTPPGAVAYGIVCLELNQTASL